MGAAAAVLLLIVLLYALLAFGRKVSATRYSGTLPGQQSPPAPVTFRCGGTIGGRLFTGLMITLRIHPDRIELDYPLGKLTIPKERIVALEVERRTLGASLLLRYRHDAGEQRDPAAGTVAHPADPGDRAGSTAVSCSDARRDTETVVLDSAYAERIRDAIGVPQLR